MEIRKNKNIHHVDWEEWLDLEENKENQESQENVEDLEWVLENNFNVLKVCLDKLPEEQKISVELFYLQKKCYKEIAEMSGFDMNKVKSYIQNGKRNLKICMERTGYEK